VLCQNSHSGAELAFSALVTLPSSTHRSSRERPVWLDPGGHVDRLAWHVQRRPLLSRLMGPMLVAVPRVLGQDLPGVSFTVDQQVVEALAPDPIFGRNRTAVLLEAA
jgi:hypothetical protein